MCTNNTASKSTENYNQITHYTKTYNCVKRNRAKEAINKQRY